MAACLWGWKRVSNSTLRNRGVNTAKPPANNRPEPAGTDFAPSAERLARGQK
jgi:hypothetical protein